MVSRAAPKNPHLAFLLSAIYGAGAIEPKKQRPDLDKSGITEASRISQGIRSVPPSDFDRLLGFQVPAVESLMLIPYPDPSGGYFDSFQVKLFPPLKDSDGHTTKYLQPRGSRPRLYFVRSVLPLVMDPAVPCYFIEGAKKTIYAAQLGLAAVGFNGIHGWHERGSRDLLDDFDRIPLRGRVVELVPDGDAASNPDVARGAAGFGRALVQRGAHVRMVVLPVAA
jgi:hypothetical protein